PYAFQKQFANKTLKQAANCGAIGYSWWQYKDVKWRLYHSSYMGLVNLKGETKTTTSRIIHGTVKPAAEEFRSYNYSANKDSCVCLQNYYNYSQHKSFRLIGHLLDEDNKPL